MLEINRMKNSTSIFLIIQNKAGRVTNKEKLIVTAQQRTTKINNKHINTSINNNHMQMNIGIKENISMIKRRIKQPVETLIEILTEL